MKFVKPRRRWYQFSLRTVFVGVTLLSVGFGYSVHWSKEWIRQRHEWLDQQPAHFIDFHEPQPLAPRGLWFFGEEALTSIYVTTEADEQRAMRLFPEAEVHLLRWPIIE